MKNDTPQMDFDILEPHSGHLKRFKQKLSNQKQHTNMPWRWLSEVVCCQTDNCG